MRYIDKTEVLFLPTKRFTKVQELDIILENIQLFVAKLLAQNDMVKNSRIPLFSLLFESKLWVNYDRISEFGNRLKSPQPSLRIYIQSENGYREAII